MNEIGVALRFHGKTSPSLQLPPDFPRSVAVFHSPLYSNPRNLTPFSLLHLHFAVFAARGPENPNKKKKNALPACFLPFRSGSAFASPDLPLFLPGPAQSRLALPILVFSITFPLVNGVLVFCDPLLHLDCILLPCFFASVNVHHVFITVTRVLLLSGTSLSTSRLPIPPKTCSSSLCTIMLPKRLLPKLLLL